MEKTIVHIYVERHLVVDDVDTMNKLLVERIIDFSSLENVLNELKDIILEALKNGFSFLS